MSKIVTYKEKPLEMIAGNELVPARFTLANPSGIDRFFLASNVYVGKYFQIGLVMGDARAEKRPGWIGSDLMRNAYGNAEDSRQEVDEDIRRGNLNEEERYFRGTVGGMAAVRLFGLPKNLMELLFESDEYLGPALIRRICEKDAVPEHFGELPVYPINKESLPPYGLGHTISEEGYGPLGDAYGFKPVVEFYLRDVSERAGSEFSFFQYVTYFQAFMGATVFPTLDEIVRMVVTRFGDAADRFDVGRNHPETRINTAILGEANSGKQALPMPQKA